MDLTIFEVHLDDASFTANAPFAGGDEEEAEAVETAADRETPSDEQGSSIIPLVVGLVVVAAVAFGVRRMLRSEPDEFEQAIPTEEEAESEVPA